jgi:hypothetical protein
MLYEHVPLLLEQKTKDYLCNEERIFWNVFEKIPVTFQCQV